MVKAAPERRLGGQLGEIVKDDYHHNPPTKVPIEIPPPEFALDALESHILFLLCTLY